MTPAHSLDPSAPLASAALRNPGPSWGYSFLLNADRVTPRWLLRPAIAAGTWIALAAMSEQRRYSREFLRVILRREPSVVEVWRHFHAFSGFMMARFRTARGVRPQCTFAEGNEAATAEFKALLASPEPALFGTFHFGYSDLLGFMLGAGTRKVAMVRQRVGNSDDTAWLARQFGEAVAFVWSNDPADVPFRLKAAIDSGHSIAMQCDRAESCARMEAFDFLGARRLFPFSIYHLGILFCLPVAFCLGAPSATGAIEVTASPVFRADPTLDRDTNLGRARVHFQAVLTALEALLLRHPYQWFNFLPLNPVVTSERLAP